MSKASDLANEIKKFRKLQESLEHEQLSEIGGLQLYITHNGEVTVGGHLLSSGEALELAAWLREMFQ